MILQIAPSSALQAPRTAERERLAYALDRTNSVLLFGGRQAGKTTLLRSLRRDNSEIRADVSVLSSLELFVYIDLSRLPIDATPAHFFTALTRRTLEACTAQIRGFSCAERLEPSDLDTFVQALLLVVASCGQVDVRIIYLLDEAKRVLGSRFPRGFQDNLFSLLFGEAGERLKIAMVFAGNQHLNELLKDDTSPIGSRSHSVYLSNLPHVSVQNLVSKLLGELQSREDAHRLTARLVGITGGHAGLTARLLERTFLEPNDLEPERWAQQVGLDSEPLFESWVLSMSPEGRELIPFFLDENGISLQMLAAWLEGRKWSRFLARRVFEEYEYTGIAIREGSQLVKTNALFWGYVGAVQFQASTAASSSQALWSLIEETELALRQLILAKFKGKFGESAFGRIEQILGVEAWQKIKAVQEKSVTQYRFVREPRERDVMSCMYLGQLGTLMVSGVTWDLFKPHFRDKRELEDKLASIAPVRNDRAHFSIVPEKEMSRCSIACDDLLAFAERELNALSAVGQGTLPSPNSAVGPPASKA